MPKSKYEARKLVNFFGLIYKSIHGCEQRFKFLYKVNWYIIPSYIVISHLIAIPYVQPNYNLPQIIHYPNQQYVYVVILRPNTK